MKIDGLPAHHAFRACCCCECRHDAQLALGEAAIRILGSARDDAECLGQQSVAAENSHGFAVDDMQGRLTAPQRVVVHGRQIVVHEGIGVNELQGARRRHRKAQRV